VISNNVKLGEPSLPVVTEDAKLRELLATLVAAVPTLQAVEVPLVAVVVVFSLKIRNKVRLV
jgi:hypothetical protein